jgi:hypothetical protein
MSIKVESILFNSRVEYLNGYGGFNQLYGLYDLIKNNFKEDFIICELGSFSGVSSELFALTCKKIFCIDAWMPYNDMVDPILTKQGEANFDKMAQKYTNIVKIKGDSSIEHTNFPNSFFDAVYIDANHAYISVKQDIQKWLPKIKNDGFICGHDYDFLPDVQKAVDEIFYGCNIKTYSDGSWIVSIENFNKISKIDNRPLRPKSLPYITLDYRSYKDDIYSPHVLITSGENKLYFVEFIDKEDNSTIHSGNIFPGCFICCCPKQDKTTLLIRVSSKDDGILYEKTIFHIKGKYSIYKEKELS